MFDSLTHPSHLFHLTTSFMNRRVSFLDSFTDFFLLFRRSMLGNSGESVSRVPRPRLTRICSMDFLKFVDCRNWICSVLSVSERLIWQFHSLFVSQLGRTRSTKLLPHRQFLFEEKINLTSIKRFHYCPTLLHSGKARKLSSRN